MYVAYVSERLFRKPPKENVDKITFKQIVDVFSNIATTLGQFV